MTYSQVAVVRRESGGITSTKDLPDSDITEKINAVDKLIDDKTSRTWTGTETSYPIVVTISELLAASLCRRRLNDPQHKAQEQWDAGMALLLELIGEEEFDTGFSVGGLDFETFSKNFEGAWSRGRFAKALDNAGATEGVDTEVIYTQNY